MVSGYSAGDSFQFGEASYITCFKRFLIVRVFIAVLVLPKSTQGTICAPHPRVQIHNEVANELVGEKKWTLSLQ